MWDTVFGGYDSYLATLQHDAPAPPGGGHSESEPDDDDDDHESKTFSHIFNMFMGILNSFDQRQ